MEVQVATPSGNVNLPPRKSDKQMPQIPRSQVRAFNSWKKDFLARVQKALEPSGEGGNSCVNDLVKSAITETLEQALRRYKQSWPRAVEALLGERVRDRIRVGAGKKSFKEICRLLGLPEPRELLGMGENYYRARNAFLNRIDRLSGEFGKFERALCKNAPQEEAAQAFLQSIIDYARSRGATTVVEKRRDDSTTDESQPSVEEIALANKVEGATEERPTSLDPATSHGPPRDPPPGKPPHKSEDQVLASSTISEGTTATLKGHSLNGKDQTILQLVTPSGEVEFVVDPDNTVKDAPALLARLCTDLKDVPPADLFRSKYFHALAQEYLVKKCLMAKEEDNIVLQLRCVERAELSIEVQNGIVEISGPQGSQPAENVTFKKLKASGAST